MIHHAVGAHEAQEVGVAGGDATEHDGEIRINLPDSCGGELHHFTEAGPAFVEVEVPVGQVIRFVPEDDGFNHGLEAPFRADHAECRASWVLGLEKNRLTKALK